MALVIEFPDAHHLERLRQRLWSGQAFGRAAILVGAGLSRNAERLTPGSVSMPDFRDLSTGMWAQLNNDLASNAPAGMDPVETASEFEGVFSRSALNDHLRRALNDAEYAPARIHRLLLSLPWADVFTTNYDTLLERAAREVNDRQYSTICSAEAIVESQRPRIIKLHGTLPDRLPFVITKEDFRRYPQTHSPFVNTVQQAVMECSLCLIGFAGNDPNFLAWSGWVRDHLGSSAPAIYLAGVLDLDIRKRTLMEHRHVVPIDLGGLFPKNVWPDPQLRHRAANEWFLLYLAQGEPDPMMWPSRTRRSASAAWAPESDFPRIEIPATTDGSSQQPELIEAFTRYPGWLTCPPSVQLSLDILIRRDWESLNSALENEARQIAEPAWISFMLANHLLRRVQSAPNLAELKERLDAWEDGSEPWFELASSYLTQLRYSERWVEHTEWQAALAQRHCSSPIRRAKLRREQALAGITRLDQKAVRAAIKDWPTLPESYQLELSRALVLVELGDIEEGTRTVLAVLSSLRRLGTPAPGDLQVLALEGVAMAFALLATMLLPQNQARSGPYGRHRELARWDCEPDEYFEAAEHTLRKIPLEQFRVVKSFDVGSYSVSSSFFSPVREHKVQAAAALRLFEALSIPFRCGNTVKHTDVAVGAAKILASESPSTAFSTFVRAHHQIDETFGLRFIARLEQAHLTELDLMSARFVHDCKDTVSKYGAFDKEGLAIVFELRSRLVVRLSADRVEAIVNDALIWARKNELLDEVGLAKSVLNCITRGYDALPRNAREALVERLLDLPLPLSSRIAMGTASWTDPIRIASIPQAAPQEVRASWTRAIEMLLVAATMAKSDEAWAAINRLVALHLSDNLTPEQSVRLGDAIWLRDEFAAYSRWYGFFPSLLLALPGSVTRDASALRISIIAKDFPSSDGQLGSARDSAERNARFHFGSVASVLEKTSSLCQSEASEMLARASIWLKQHLARTADPLAKERGSMAGDTTISSFIDLLMDHILPCVSDPKPVDVATLADIRQELATEMLSSLELEYHFQRFGLSQVNESADRLARGLRSKNDFEVIDAVDGILAWLKTGSAPPALLDNTIEVLRRTGARSFSVVMGRVAAFIRNHPQQLPRDAPGRLASILDTVIEDTDLTLEENDRLFSDPAWMADARYSAAYLAATLWKHFPELHSELVSWSEKLPTDPVIRAREIWLKITCEPPTVSQQGND